MDSGDLDKYFGVADFAVFFASMILSALIGLYFGYRDKNKKSIETYYYGDRRVSPIAVGMSMAVSFVSAVTVIGYPVETYFYGILFLWSIGGILLGAIFSAVYFIPFIFRLQMKSIYEYLEWRYNRTIRLLCSGVSVLQLIIYMGTTVYLPALALNSVTPLDLEWTIALTSVICTFYTTLGGVKAVIWTDVLQSFIMAFGCISLFVAATVQVGGIGIVMNTANTDGRMNLFRFESDIRDRTSAANFFLAYLILSANGSCFSQVFAQRYLSCKSISTARKAMVTRFFISASFLIFAAIDGLAMYAFYSGCDPYTAGFVYKKDQLTARFAVEVFQSMPGMSGLFVAAAYSGTLSTVSSGINSLAALATEDFIGPRWPDLPMSKKSYIAKIFSIVFGCLVMGVAYLVSRVQSTIVQITMSLAGIFTGPMFAVFLWGSLCPWINGKGALGGLITGWIFSAWISVGRIIYGAAPEFTETLPVSIEECVLNTTSMELGSGSLNMTTAVGATELPSYRPPLADTLYSISPFLYGLMGFLVASVCMVILSGLTGFNKTSEMKPELFVPLVENKKLFHERVVKFFRFGVPELTEEKKHEEEIPLKTAQ